MARYWTQSLVGLDDPATPSAEALEGMQQLERSRWEAPMRGQDLVPVVGRRIILQASVGASPTGWRFNTGQPSESLSADVPHAVGSAQLGPGCFLLGALVCLPSGGVGGTPPEDGFGLVRLQVTWSAQGVAPITSTHDVQLPVSELDDYDVATGSGAAWGDLLTVPFQIAPPVNFSAQAEARDWARGVTVEIEAYQLGAPRIVDMVLHEWPYVAAWESDDAGWSSHIFATGTVDDHTLAAGIRPRTRKADDDPDGNPRGGTWHTAEVGRAQRVAYGPHLLSWGHYQEHTSTPSAGLAALQRTGTAAGVGLFDAALTAWDDAREGLSVSCGGYGRQWRHASAEVMGGQDEAATIPVCVRVYGRTLSGTATIRVMTSTHSWVDVELTTSQGWHEGWGHLTVGVTPDQPTTAQVFVIGAQTVEVWGLSAQAAR